MQLITHPLGAGYSQYIALMPNNDAYHWSKCHASVEIHCLLLKVSKAFKKVHTNYGCNKGQILTFKDPYTKLSEGSKV